MKNKLPKTILLENNGWLTDSIHEFASQVDPNYVELDPNQDYYSRNDDIYWFSKLIQPELQNIIVSSAFNTKSPGIDECGYNTQVGWFLNLLEQALHYRKDYDIPGITLYVRYKGDEGFVEWLKRTDDDKHDNLGRSLRFLLKMGKGLPFKIFVKDDFSFQRLTELTHEILTK